MQRINETRESELSAAVFEEYNEQFPYLLAAALLLLVIEVLMLDRRNRLLARLPLFREK